MKKKEKSLNKKKREIIERQQQLRFHLNFFLLFFQTFFSDIFRLNVLKKVRFSRENKNGETDQSYTLLT